MRIERFDEAQSYSDAFSYISKFYSENGSEGTGVHEPREWIKLNFLLALVGLLTEYPQQVVVALAHMIEHLSKFKISRLFRNQTRFKQFMERNHMLLNANTLTNLYVTHASTSPFPWSTVDDVTERSIIMKPIIK